MRRIIGASLIGLGTFLVAAGVFVRFYVAPTLIGAPTDVYQVTRLEARNATYLDASSLTVRTGATVSVTSTVRGDVEASGGDVAVYDTGTIIQDAARGTRIEIQNARFPFDRRTGELRNCCGAAVQGDTNVRMAGIGLFWPVEARTDDLEVFDTGTLRAWPVVFDGEERVDGLLTYRFVQRVPATQVAGDVPALPAALFGRPEGGPAVAASRYYQADVTFWIDPRTGAPVDQRRHVVTTLRPEEGPGSLVVADLDLRMTQEAKEDLRAKSDDGAAKLRLLEAVVPLAAVGLGLQHHLAGADQPEPADAVGPARDDLRRVHVPGTQRGRLHRQQVDVPHERGGPAWRLWRGDLAVDRAAPVVQDQALLGRGEPDDVAPGRRGQRPGAHLFDPTSRPETNCFWNAKNTIAVGTAATSEPAAMTFQALE